MKWLVPLLVLASGSTVPAVVSSPPPVPGAVGPAGVSVSGQVGSDIGALRRGAATVVARPLANVGLFASGHLARRDSGDVGTRWVRYRYAEAGILGAMPLAPAAWLEGGASVGAGEAESGASVLGGCDDVGCSELPYIVAADVSRVSARLGVHAENGDGLSFGAGARFVRAAYSDVRQDRLANELPTDDFTLWIAEPYVTARYALAPGATLDLFIARSALLSPAPRVPFERGPGALYTTEPTSVNLGATLDLWRLLGSR